MKSQGRTSIQVVAGLHSPPRVRAPEPATLETAPRRAWATGSTCHSLSPNEAPHIRKLVPEPGTEVNSQGTVCRKRRGRQRETVDARAKTRHDRHEIRMEEVRRRGATSGPTQVAAHLLPRRRNFLYYHLHVMPLRLILDVDPEGSGMRDVHLHKHRLRKGSIGTTLTRHDGSHTGHFTSAQLKKRTQRPLAALSCQKKREVWHAERCPSET